MIKPKIIAHRGLRMKYPENSIPAIQAAIDLGVDGVEFDVELTKDLQPVVLHQETLIAQGGQLAHADRNHQSKWVYRADSSIFPELNVPFLKEVLALDWKSVVPNIELKDPFFWEKRNTVFENQIISAVKPFLPDSARILSFNEYLLKEFSSYFTVLNVWTTRNESYPELIELCHKFSINCIQVADCMLLKNPELVNLAHENGLECSFYSVSPAYNEPDFQSWVFEAYQGKLEKLLSLKPDAVVVDFVEECIEELHS